ncbi:TIGR04141 family sporadically distributed protein [Xanthomonas arboricola]|uniref:TIGR04141 family sporadically distributed protein n=1 Tax=Xanthomonas arboricola TaxID=56448 RepID=UPI000E1E3539|nr:TIGR04141 family sporadically distributed protein [Xanthomonas arboricola]
MSNLTVTVFLIRRNYYPEFNKFLKKLGSGFDLSGGLRGRFYPIEDDEKFPAWVNMIAPKFVPVIGVQELKSQSPAGLMSCKIKNKLLVITFGHAWMKLKNDWVESDFGRRICLNVIEENDLKQLRSEQILAKRHRSIERSPQNANLYAFNYESDRDLVFSVEGIGKKSFFRGNIRGGAPLRFDVEPDFLPKALFAAIKKMGYGYRNKFPDIDNLIPITLKDEIEKLDLELEKEITAGNVTNRITMAPPASLEVFDSDIYFFHGRWAGAIHSKSWSLVYAEWVASLKSVKPTLEIATRKSIHVVDAATASSKSTISPRESFSFDVTRPDGHFVTFSGKWYKASPNLENKISIFLKGLLASSFVPPAWNQTDHEGAYNKNACLANLLLVHMDARNVSYGGGYSRFEFCDFADPINKVLYFVKNPGSAAGMSHLYEQARRTSELFFGNNYSYLNNLIFTVQKNHPTLAVDWLVNYPRSSDWEICLVSMGKHADQLPMFAKCGLMRVHRELSTRFRAVTYSVI